MILHPDRWNPAPARKHGVVVHDAESGDGAAPVLLRLLAAPGDRTSSSGSRYGSGYHAVTDGTGGYVRAAPPECGPFHAPPCNSTWAAVCMPGYARQTRAEWLDELSRAHIRGVARFIVDQWELDRRTWPLDFQSAAELRAAGIEGARGITSHAQVSQAWHKTDHTDPGLSFPWDVLMADVAELVDGPPAKPPTPNPSPTPSPTTPEETTMPFLIQQAGDAHVWAVIAAPGLRRNRARVHVTAEQFPAWNAAFGPIAQVSDVSAFGDVVGPVA